MSAVTANFTVAPVNLSFVVDNNNINFTPNAISLGIYTSDYSGIAIGLNANVANVHIFDGANGYVLSTDGFGNLTWVAQSLNANYASYAGNVTINAQPNITSTGTLTSLNVTGTTTGAAFTANTGVFTGNGNGLSSIVGANVTGTVPLATSATTAGTVTTAAQPNITSHGSLTGLTVSNATGTVNFSNSANVTLGAVANLHIVDGVNGYVLQTDGLGNLSWTAQTGGNAGNGTPGGANTQVQFNDAGVFGGNSGFTFNKTTGNLTAANVLATTFTGALSGAATTAGTVTTAAQPNITSFGTLTSLAVTGNISAGNITAPVILPYGIENLNLIAAQTGTYNFDIISNAIRYTNSNASANLTLNFRGNATVSANTLLANGQSVTGTYVFKTGATAYGITALQVDTSVQTIKWAGNIIPIQVANTLTPYVFTIVKTTTTPTYDVLGSATRYG